MPVFPYSKVNVRTRTESWWSHEMREGSKGAWPVYGGGQGAVGVQSESGWYMKQRNGPMERNCRSYTDDGIRVNRDHSPHPLNWRGGTCGTRSSSCMPRYNSHKQARLGLKIRAWNASLLKVEGIVLRRRGGFGWRYGIVWRFSTEATMAGSKYLRIKGWRDILRNEDDSDAM